MSDDLSGDGTPAAQHLLRIENLRTAIRRPGETVYAVDGVDLAIAPGETLGLVGESGCGKTMTGSSILRLLPPGARITSGHVWFDGHDLTRVDEKTLRRVRGRDIGMVFQDPMTSLNPVMTVGKQIAEAVRHHRGLDTASCRARAIEVLDLVRFPQAARRVNSYPHQLSGGMRQRVMIAIALACQPRLLIADEPTTALDVTTQAQILRLLRDLKSEINMALLLITHDMGVIAEQADRVMVMYAGKIVESAETGHLFTSMRHPYTQALLESIPRPDQDRELPLLAVPGAPPEPGTITTGCRFAPRCAHATERCRAEDPPPRNDPNHHTYTCFHPVGSPGDLSIRLATATNTSDSTTAPTAITDRDPARIDLSEVALLELRDITKTFVIGSTMPFTRTRRATLPAVDNVSLSIREGETFAIVGESGCGKTTLGRVMVGLDTPTAGRVLLSGADLRAMKPGTLRRTRREMQLMFQDPTASLDPRMRIGTIIREPLAIQRLGSAREQRRTVVELLGDVGLSAHTVDRFPHELSGGQRQRVGLARALALRPRIVVADEPVSALDVSVRSQILNLMRTVQRTHQLTYVVITHDLSVASYLADRIGVMYLGQLVEIGPAADIYTRPAHPYTAALLDSIPLPTAEAPRRRQSLPVLGEVGSPLDPPSGCRFRTRCSRAEERCRRETPPPRVFGASHTAACHIPLRDPVSPLTSSSGSSTDNAGQQVMKTSNRRGPDV